MATQWLHLALLAGVLGASQVAASAAHEADILDALGVGGVPEADVARELAASWGIGRPSYERSLFSIAQAGRSLHDVAASNDSSGLVAVVLGDQPPRRRNVSAQEPFLWADTQATGAVGALLLDSMNRGAGLVEAATGRPLFPFRLVAGGGLPFGAAGPWALWDTASGAVHLSPRLLAALGRLAPPARQAVADTAGLLFPMAGERSQGATTQGWQAAYLVAGSSFAVVARRALPAALAGAVPLWFCIACPVVLGLLAPLLFNAGLGGSAELVCEHYQLPQQECSDLWFAAFGLALLLSLAAVFPIVAVCQLRRCARQG